MTVAQKEQRLRMEEIISEIILKYYPEMENWVSKLKGHTDSKTNQAHTTSIIIEFQNTGHRQTILRASREKGQVAYKDQESEQLGLSKHCKIEDKKEWFQIFEGNYFQPRILHTAKLWSNYESRIKTVSDMQGLKIWIFHALFFRKIGEDLLHQDKC